MTENKDICPSIEGAKPINRLKNRYKDVLPCKFKSINKIYLIENCVSFKMINIELFFNRITIQII